MFLKNTVGTKDPRHVTSQENFSFVQGRVFQISGEVVRHTEDFGQAITDYGCIRLMGFKTQCGNVYTAYVWEPENDK